MTGHAVPEVVDAIRTQAGRMLHTSTLYLVRPMIELAERISALSGIPDAKVFFVNSGSEANDTALQLCCTARRSNQILALRYSYHGRSFASMAVTGLRSWSASSLTPVNVSYVHGGYRYRSPFGHLPDDEYIAACVADLRGRDPHRHRRRRGLSHRRAHPGRRRASSCRRTACSAAMQATCSTSTGILFVSDEVQTGWGRTGEHFWGYQAHGVTPDLLTFAKGLGNGLAIGGVAGRADLIDAVHANSISTFGGNPLATAGALANLDYLLSHDLQANALAAGPAAHATSSARSPTSCRVVGEVRGRGLMVAIELVGPGGRDPDPAAAGAALEGCRRRGLLVGKGGVHGNVLRIAPPLSVSAAEIERGRRRSHRGPGRGGRRVLT